MYVLAVKVKVNIHKQQEFLQVLRSLQSDEAGEKGVTNLKLVEEGEDRTCYSLIDRWETEADLTNYLRGEKFKVLLGALQVLCEEAAVQYKFIPENLIHHLEPMFHSAN
jgi:quinol monooxygenase YgiN